VLLEGRVESMKGIFEQILAMLEAVLTPAQTA
jgi:hypothetical protein